MPSLLKAAVRNRLLPAFIVRTLAGLVLLGTLASCSTPGHTSATLPADAAFLANYEEDVYSEIAQRNQHVLLQIELVDMVRPRQRLTLDGIDYYAVPAGNRRVQFRVVLHSMGWMDSGPREARGFVDVTLVPGHRYYVAGKYDQAKRSFHLQDLTTNQAVSPEVDLGFFAPIRNELQYVPIIINIKT